MQRIILAVLGASATTLIALPGSAAEPTTTELAAQSGLTLEGHVLEVRPNGGDHGGGKLATLKVEKVLNKPAAVTIQPDQNVNVRLTQEQEPVTGAYVRFYLRPEIYADTITATEIAHMPVEQNQDNVAATGTRSGVGSSPASSGAESLRNQLSAESTAVIVGRVKEIRTPNPALLSAALGGRQPVSEHDPQMKEAVVEVQEAVKGANPGEELLVLFPSSKDVAWFKKSPKIEAGQVSTFLLKREPQLSKFVSQPNANVFSIEKKDVLPVTEATQLRALLK